MGTEFRVRGWFRVRVKKGQDPKGCKTGDMVSVKSRILTIAMVGLNPVAVSSSFDSWPSI
jgi:hypothetical protein